MMQFLDGKKTYILGTVGILTVAGYLFGWIDGNVANTILSLCGFGGLITLRSAISKV